MFELPCGVLKKLRKDYPEGTRIELVKMVDPYANMPAGIRGTVTHVDCIGAIHTLGQRFNVGCSLRRRQDSKGSNLDCSQLVITQVIANLMT